MNSNSDAPLTYAQSGVDIDAGNQLVEAIKPAVRSTSRSGSDTEIGGFGGLFDLKAAGFEDPILVCANDGVGTKLRIAIETERHDTVGVDLVAMCVNDLVVQGAEPLLFLDYYATGKLDIDAGKQIIEGIADGCRQAGAALIGGETAEMPGWKNKAPFAPDVTVADAFLEPTRIYVKPLLTAIRDTGKIKAMAHITGGGFTENIPRVLPDDVTAEISLSCLPKMEIFDWLAKEGNVEESEMLRTFNCGIGMVVVVDADDADEVIASLEASGETAMRMGRITEWNDEDGAVHYVGAKW